MMKKYEVGIGILNCCFDFNSIEVEARSKGDAFRKFCKSIIDELENIDYEEIAKTDDGWIYEDKKDD